MNFLKIYFWQIVSIIFNFATVFVVTPFLSSNPAIFGIYSIVTAAYIFLSYADLGFLSAGMKYASECFARNERKEEIMIIGFAGFIFLIFVILFSIIMLGFSFYPNLLVSQLKPGLETQIAKQLLLILAIFAPTFVLQRILLIIFAIRLEDYRFQPILIISNIIKICSVFYFFSNGRYDITGYFLFSQIFNLLAVIAGMFLAKKVLQYDLIFMLKSIKYSKELFNKTKKLAFSSLFLTLCWIAYYEMDPFVIGKIFGSSKVAIYAIALTLMSYFRSILGIIFSPFMAKFNHYVGLNDLNGLRETFFKLMILTVPITVFPVITLDLFAKNFIYSWVGESYHDSVLLARFFVGCYLFNFITSPGGILLMAKEKVKLMYITNGLLPLIFWIGILFSYSFWGIYSFGVFKLIAFFIAAVMYFKNVHLMLELPIMKTVKEVLLPTVLPIITIVLMYMLLKPLLPLNKSKLNLMVNMLYICFTIFISIVVYFFMSIKFREFVEKGVVAARLKISSFF